MRAWSGFSDEKWNVSRGPCGEGCLSPGDWMVGMLEGSQAAK